MIDFQPFSKIARLSREVVVTEKIDGTNAQILIVPASECSVTDDLMAVSLGDKLVPGSLNVYAGSRNRLLCVNSDNFGFARWVEENADELRKLGPGRHFGEWWGKGIQRGYGQTQKRFSLFNVHRWMPENPGNPFSAVIELKKESDEYGAQMVPTGNRIECCHVVPTIWRGNFDTGEINDFIEMLRIEGSFAAPGFPRPEGIVIYHTASGQLFKKTLIDDEKPKSQV